MEEEKKVRKPRVIKMKPEPKQDPKLVARIIPQSGHTLFEVNKVDMTIKPAIYKMVERTVESTSMMSKILRLPKDVVYVTKDVPEVIVQPNCLYISALNAKNVMKILVRNFGFQPEQPLNKKNHGIEKIKK
jgi:hypothetical protein